MGKCGKGRRRKYIVVNGSSCGVLPIQDELSAIRKDWSSRESECARMGIRVGGGSQLALSVNTVLTSLMLLP